MSETSEVKEKHYFFLNPYDGTAFTKCPKCEGKTKQRKIPLVIVLEKEKMFVFLNKTCKYCPCCDLLIARKSEMEEILKQLLKRESLDEKDYAVIGTQEKSLWRKKAAQSAENLNSAGVALFKNVWKFTAQPAGWCFGRSKKT